MLELDSSIRTLKISFDYIFGNKQNVVKITNITPCIAASFFHNSEDFLASNFTGCWCQLENTNGDVLYRRAEPYLVAPSGVGVIDLNTLDNKSIDFAVLVPNIPDGRFISIYMTPCNGNTMSVFGTKSELAGRFELTQDLIKKTPRNLKVTTLPDDICKEGLGKVLSINRILNHGHVNTNYNFIILGDCFTNSEQSDFIKATNRCTQHLFSITPFSDPKARTNINVFYVEVQSNSNVLGEGYFSANKKGKGTRIVWSRSCVKKVCDRLFSENGHPYWHWAAIIVNENSIDRGTTVGHQMALTISDDLFASRGYWDVFVHEFGHAALGLADEYADKSNDGQRYLGDEPHSPNVTIQTHRNKIKWKKDFRPKDIRIPTISDPPGCKMSDGKDPYLNGVGLYPGGKYYSCGVYHPSIECLMKSSKAGYFCEICKNEGYKLINTVHNYKVPSPGLLKYSDITKEWLHLDVNPTTYRTWARIANYEKFNELINDELHIKKIGPIITKIFKQYIKHKNFFTLSNAEIIEAFFIIGVSEGLWYLMDTTTKEVMFFRSYTVASDTFILVGSIAFPEYFKFNLVDMVVVGIQPYLFSIGGYIAKGKIDDKGKIQDGALKIQTVKHLENLVTDLTIELISTKIWVGVVDNLSVKISAFELINDKWLEQGFIKMPTPSLGTNEKLKSGKFLSVKIVKVNKLLYVMSKTDAELVLATFDIINNKWTENISISPMKIRGGNYDITADQHNIHLFVWQGREVKYYVYSPETKKWNDGTDITTALNLVNSDTIFDMNIVILEKKLHVVALINGVIKHAIYGIFSKEWIQSLTRIPTLEPYTIDVEKFALHADNGQLHLAITDVKPNFFS